MTELTFIEAGTKAVHEEMLRDDRVFVLGEDISWNFFGTTAGLVEAFGEERVRDTPIAEAGFVGTAAGAAMVGMRPVVDMMIAPFFYVAMDQVVSIVAKSTYLYGGQAKMPVTFRATMFYGVGVAGQHSDRPISTFMTIPGLKIIAPSCPRDLKGMLKTAIREDDPVICFEDCRAWGIRQDVPDDDELIPLGSADVKRRGSDVTVVGVAGTVNLALEAAERLEGSGISVEVVDLRSVVPLDAETILESVRKTGRLVVADPSHELGSVASEIAAIVVERGFHHLDAPIIRVTTPHVHIPFSPPLEHSLYPSVEKIVAAVRSVLA
jgi:acetoin:2,6-dichlorophenolindophenol oxidoreductase subunit beta